MAEAKKIEELAAKLTVKSTDLYKNILKELGLKPHASVDIKVLQLIHDTMKEVFNEGTKLGSETVINVLKRSSLVKKVK